MKTIIVTGSAGLVGSECVRYFAKRELNVVGIDNDMRARLFGKDASTAELLDRMRFELPDRYRHVDIDIRDSVSLESTIWASNNIVAVIHTAAQPSHDWAARDPQTDFGINAVGTLNLLEATRKHCPKAAFVFTSTNKVYGDRPNGKDYTECETRFEPSPAKHEMFTITNGVITTPAWWNGFDEWKEMCVDQCTHSIFGASKLSADILVQEYGRYFGMNTVCFRGGCLTGPAHQGTKLHGFLSYLVRCAMTGEPYTVIGYKGKQVRDNLHSADLVAAFDEYIRAPRPGEVYNIGGGRGNSCSVREAIRLVEEISGKAIDVRYEDEPRIGDHKWWITDTRKFREHYPGWKVRIGLREIVEQIVEAHR